MFEEVIAAMNPFVALAAVILVALGVWKHKELSALLLMLTGPKHEPSARSAPAATPEAHEEFTRVCRDFEGLYGTLHLACQADGDADRPRRVLGEWETRIRYSGAPTLIRAWNAIVSARLERIWLSEVSAYDATAWQKLAREWYRQLQQLGVAQDDRDRLTIAEGYSEYYDVEGDVAPGDQALIERPCWFCDRDRKTMRVVEKGRARVVRA